MMTDTVIVETPTAVDETSETLVDVNIVEYNLNICETEESSCFVDLASSHIIEIESVSEIATVEVSSQSAEVITVDVGIPGLPGRHGFEWTTTQW